MLNPTLERFDIRNFAERLISKQGKNRYQCPVCEEGTLSIDPKTGAYHCWGDGCPSELIREAVNPLSEALARIGIEKKDFVPKKHIPKQKPIINPAPIPNGIIKLGTLPQSVTEEARVRLGSSIEIKYPYSATQWVNRTEYPNGKKITLPYHINSNGETVNRKGDQEWPSYRFDEIVKYGAGQWVLGVEGEKVTDISRSIFGFLSTTFQGGSWSQEALDKYFQAFKDAGVIGFIYDPDHDKTGYSKAEKCKIAAAKAGLPFIALDPIRLWADCPSGGDIADWVKAGLANSEALHQEINRIADELRGLPQKKESIEPTQKQESISDWEQQRAKTATYNLTRTANLTVDSGYLPSLKLSDIPSPLLGVVGNCGAGKSVFISNILKEWNENVIQIAHLNNLLSNTAPKFDLMHHFELKELGLSVMAYGRLAITDISMAAKLEVSAWLGDKQFILVLDEVEQVLKSIQLNKNLRGNSLRLKARVKLEWMIKNAAYVICSDRDLCDETIEYIEQIRGEKMYLIHHTGKKGLNKMPVKMVVNKDKAAVLKSFYADVKQGLKVIIGCENRSDLTAIELELQKMGINDKEILTVHGENSNEKEIKDLIADIDKQYHNYRIFGYTSTLGTGISLDTQHFDKAYYFVSGDVLQASEIIQLMSRYRPDVNTTIWCNSITRQMEINPGNLLTDIQENLKETKGLIDAIDKFDYFVKEGIFVDPLGKIPKEDIPWINHKLSILARLNASRANPSKSLYDELVKDGYRVILDDSEVENNYLDGVHKANKEQIKLIQDETVAKSETMNDEQYKNARMNPGSLDKKEQAQFKKTRLVHELGVHETEINVSLVELERTKGVVSGAKALKIVLGDKDTALAYDLRDKESNPDPFDQSFHTLKWQYFHDLGFDKFLAEIKEDFSYSKDSELVIEIANEARKSASKFKRVVGIDISKKKSDCAIIGHLLDKLCILREKPEKGKNKARIYKINMQHYELLINAVSHINSQEKTLTMERLINSKIDQTMVSECAEVIRLAFEADNPIDEYELIKTVGTDIEGNEYPKLVKKLIFNQLTKDEQIRVRQTAKAAKELIEV